jgi:phosphocarrier protein HPr
MIKKNFVIANPQGFHVRPTKEFVNKAITFPCDVFLEYKTKRMNGKSTLGLMALGLTQHAEVTLEVNGEREEEAIETLGEVLTSIFE